MNDNNLDIEATVHWYDGSDNAFWNPEQKQIYFLDPGQRGFQFTGALDVVAHEYSHGVTTYTSGLIYWDESGALNESFSDIIGAAVEFYWQEPGDGLLKSDWLNGEDSRPYYSTAECRNLEDPNTNSQLKNAGFPSYLWYPDPCHLSQKIPPIIWYGSLVDSGGVHLNMTIYSHAYYLLSNGGTNKVSGKSVAGIGIEKATKIFYRAWTYWMTSTSSFWNAGNYLLWSAAHLYGSASNEYAQTIKAMEAIGWTVI
jgi:thermolysin